MFASSTAVGRFSPSVGSLGAGMANPAPRPAGRHTVLSLVGNTPMLDLSHLARERGAPVGVRLLAKAEWFNPGGSVKARAAYQIIADGERAGALTPEKILIDSSSGNTAIAYALMGAAKGYRVHLVMPANVSRERKALVRAYGATLIESDPLEGSDGAIQEVRRLVAANPDRYFYADQYNNPSNWRAHYHSTGPEIWRQTQGTVTHFVAGLGTTGTFMGTGRYLKERNPAVELVAVQPEDELAVVEGLKHLATAMVPGIYDAALPDRHLAVGPDTAWEMTRYLAHGEGLFVGISAGAAVAAALNLARQLEEGVLVTILPDDGSKYLSLGIFDRS